MNCEHCGKELTPKVDNYIKLEEERFCGDCFESWSMTHYSIGGEYLASDDDGVVEYGIWSTEGERE